MFGFKKYDSLWSCLYHQWILFFLIPVFYLHNIILCLVTKLHNGSLLLTSDCLYGYLVCMFLLLYSITFSLSLSLSLSLSVIFSCMFGMFYVFVYFVFFLLLWTMCQK